MIQNTSFCVAASVTYIWKMIQTITSPFCVFRTYLIAIFPIITPLTERPTFSSPYGAESHDITGLNFRAPISFSMAKFVCPIPFQFS